MHAPPAAAHEPQALGPIAVVALVGYTNAGKSTLFNALTHAGVFADNLLFATLDPTLRQVELPNGTEVILSDTVGFVADLPTTLVAAFRATLEEVAEADLILHVRDIAHPGHRGAGRATSPRCSPSSTSTSNARHASSRSGTRSTSSRPTSGRPASFRHATNGKSGGSPLVVSVAALTGEGLPELLQAIENRLSEGHAIYRIQLDGARLADLHKLYDFGEVLEREDRGDEFGGRPGPGAPERPSAASAQAFPGATAESVDTSVNARRSDPAGLSEAAP